jgi:Bacteriophage probable baseplate hub protein
MTEPLFAAVAPVFTVDGELVRPLARDCARLEITEGVDGLKRMQAEFIAVGGHATGPPDGMYHLDGATVDFGRSIRVTIGPEGNQRHVFEGQVSALEAVFGDGDPPTVVVLAEDVLMRLRMTRRMRTYVDATDADIAAELAGEHGLSADVSADGPRYDVVQQWNQSDLAFLRERARLIRAELWATGRTLHFRSRTDRSGTTVTLTQGVDLLSARLTADLAEQRSSVVVTGYDATSGKTIEERAGADVADTEITTGRSGPRLVAKAMGDAISYRVREAALTADEATAWSRAEMLRRARRFVTVHGTTRGSPEMVVGSRLTLRHVGAPFDGSGYYVTKVCHLFDPPQGFRTRFEAERPSLNEVSR